MPRTTDVKGQPVEIDTLVQGFTGFTKKVAQGRVVMVSQWGWIVAYDPDGPEGNRQHVFYADKFLVRGEPRPLRQRGDIPERLVHA